VSFSVNGPVDPHTEGIRDPRGAPPTPQIPFQPGNPIGACIRTAFVAQAAGIPSFWPGDVFDYLAFGVPSEAVLFQSAPFPPPAPPDGTDQQIVESMALGLVAGPFVPPPFWTLVPPMMMPRDNVDALSFGEDYFPPALALGLAPDPFPPPGMPMPTPWELRFLLFAEPIVFDDDPGIEFRFSVDPWAMGLLPTAVSLESGPGDLGLACGPWTSDGEAAGDVFSSLDLLRAGGATVGGGLNFLEWDQIDLALAPVAPPLMPAEDDLDGLECIGDNSVPWFAGMLVTPGSVHDRVLNPGFPEPAPPGMSVHEPMNDAPLFFSVTRNSPGEAFTGVRSQFVIDGGAAADIFVTAKSPMDPAGVGTNLLFIDESEIGLYAAPGASDDLDALILWVCPDYRDEVTLAIEEILGLAFPFMPGGYAPWSPYGSGDALVGGGMTISITKYLYGTGRPIPPGCIQVGFSVSTDSIGLEFTAVDHEAGGLMSPIGASEAAGDVFYAEVDGAALGTNWLWYEEVDLGLDPGFWISGMSGDLSELPDNLDALDSAPPGTGMTSFCASKPSSIPACVPTLSAASPMVSKSGGPPNAMIAGPVPGGPGKPAILLYSDTGLLAMPVTTAFGLLCLDKFKRLGSFPATPGGTSGTCSGAYMWDLAAIAVATPGITVGDDLFLQAWYRDTGFPPPGNANFTNGVGPIEVVP
jgi:hypothetical protein